MRATSIIEGTEKNVLNFPSQTEENDQNAEV